MPNHNGAQGTALELNIPWYSTSNGGLSPPSVLLPAIFESATFPNVPTDVNGSDGFQSFGDHIRILNRTKLKLPRKLIVPVHGLKLVFALLKISKTSVIS